MSPLLEFLDRLLDEGEVILRHRPFASVEEREEGAARLARAYASYRLGVAGPRIDFDAATATAAGELVWHACWFLLNRAEPQTELEKHLNMPAPTASAAQHLSADLVLRYLPQVYRRARALAPDDLLPALLAKLLREWPLTGVLSAVAEEPLTPLEFGGHPGLMLLYAERLAQNAKPAWIPRGRTLEYVEWVIGDLGKERVLLPHRLGVESSDGERKGRGPCS